MRASEEKKLELEIEKRWHEIQEANKQISSLEKDQKALEEQLRKRKTTQLKIEQQKKILQDLRALKQSKTERFSEISSLEIQLAQIRYPEQFESVAPPISVNTHEPKANLTPNPPENVATVVVIPIEIPLPFQDKEEPSETLFEELIGEIKGLMATPTKEKSPVAAAAVVSETQQPDANSNATEIKITVVAADADAVTPSFHTPRSPTLKVSPGISDAKQPIQPSINNREPDANASEIISDVHRTVPFSRDQIRKLPRATAPISGIPIADDSPVFKKFWDVSKKIETGSFLFFIATGATFSMIEKWGNAQGKHLDVVSSFAQNNPTMTLFGSGLISAVALSQLWRAMFSLCYDGQNKSMITSSETTSESEKSKMELQLIKVTVFITCMVCLLVPLQFYLDHKASTISNTIGNTIKNASAGYFLLIQPILALNFSLLAKLGYEMGRYALSKCRATSLSPNSLVGQRRDSQLSAISMPEQKPLLPSHS